MGNSCSKRTVKEVTDDLENELLASAKNLLDKEFNQKLDPNHSSLQDTVLALAKAEFSKTFGYDWSPTSVSPPNIDSDNPQYHLASDYCIVPADEDITKAIAKYVNDGLGSSGIDDWMKKKAVADLSTIIGKYITYPVDTTWHYGPGVAQYDAVNPNEDSYKLDLSLVYTNATKTESAVEVSLHIFYFVGAYYTIKSPKAVTFEKLRKHAWDAATALPNAGQTVTSDPQLQTALFNWGTALGGPFNNDFQRRWDGQPDDFATDESRPIDTRNGELAFFGAKDLTEDYLDKYIDANIMIGFDLRLQGLQDWAKALLVKEYQAAFRQTNLNGWSHKKVDQTYGLKDLSIRPVRLNGEIVSWASEATITDANQPVTIYVYYIFFLGYFYELEPDPILKDMSKTLVQNIPGQGTVPSYVGPDQVKAAVETFNSSRFSSYYGYEFPTKVDPKDTSKKAWSTVFEFDHWNPNDGEIKAIVDDKIFVRDPKEDTQIHHDLQPIVYDWIVKMASDISGKTFTKDPNGWYQFNKNNSFPYIGPKTKTPYVLQTDTAWAYCNATITEDGRGGETLNYFYLSVLIHVNAHSDDVNDSDV